MVNIHGRSSSVSEIPGESRSLCQTGNQMKLIGHMVNLTSEKVCLYLVNINFIVHII